MGDQLNFENSFTKSEGFFLPAMWLAFKRRRSQFSGVTTGAVKRTVAKMMNGTAAVPGNHTDDRRDPHQHRNTQDTEPVIAHSACCESGD
jgi:hypothetical protein